MDEALPGHTEPVASRRSRRRRKRGPRITFPGPLVAICAVLAVVVGLGEATLPDDRAQLTGLHEERVPIGMARLVCPDAGSHDVAMVAPGSGKGRATLHEVGSDGSAAATLDSGPSRTSSAVDGSANALVATAKHGAAPGFEAAEYDRDNSGSDRGLRDTRCVRPGRSWWFAGATIGTGYEADLYLSNVDSSPATVDIRAYGKEGPVDPLAGRGITVDAGKRKVVDLSRIAPHLSMSALHVVAQSGRVSAALRVQAKEDDTSYGVSWVPPSQQPAKDVVVPAVPAGSGDRKLVLFAPGQQGTTASVRLSTPDGSYAPAGHDSVNVPARQAVAVGLGDVMAKSATAVQVTASVPLVAAVVAIEGGSGEDGSIAYSASTAALHEPGAVPVVPSGGNLKAALELTAPRDDATVTVTALHGTKSEKLKSVRVPAGRTVKVKLKPRWGGSPYAVVLDPLGSGGPVYASRVLTATPGAGPLISAQPVVSSERAVTLPPVVSDVGAGVPG
ncbi:MAG: DUF5719 family protein [Streptosporangiales bacterium]